MYCLDASVIINAQRPTEPHAQASRAFFEIIKREQHKVFLPEIAIPEITAGLYRGTKDPELAYEFAMALRDLPNLSFVSVDRGLADLAARLIRETGLRGADAIYLALAQDYGLALVTLDKDQLQHGKRFVVVRRP